jgi:hypothetical protein
MPARRNRNQIPAPLHEVVKVCDRLVESTRELPAAACRPSNEDIERVEFDPLILPSLSPNAACAQESKHVRRLRIVGVQFAETMSRRLTSRNQVLSSPAPDPDVPVANQDR